MENSIKTAAIIYNPVATRFNMELLAQVTKKLEEHGIEVVSAASEYAGHVIPLVKQYNPLCDLILSIGGDGTMGECFQGFHGEKQYALYSHLPAGTANDSTKNLGLKKKDNIASLDMILNGEIKETDILTINGTPFGNASALGFLASMVYETPRSLKYRFGKTAYVLFAVKNITKLFRKVHLKYYLDGEECEDAAVLTLITNSKNFSNVEIYKHVEVDDGLFEVLFLRRLSFKVLLQVISDCLKGGINFPHYGDAVKTFSTGELTLCFDNNKTVYSLCNDGDKYPLERGDLELKFKTDGKIRMLLPAGLNAMSKAKTKETA
ncbi:MAG: hypothetical protein FWF08_05820 [Oscillospiraceae bacterium]|nr:hypothetical protein [Oscillospiraceae bacterium]